MQEVITTNNFKGHILEEVGIIPISNTQKIRVLLIRDDEGRMKISAQKWWRNSTEGEWIAGKGFNLTNEQSATLGSLLTQASGKLQGM